MQTKDNICVSFFLILFF